MTTFSKTQKSQSCPLFIKQVVLIQMLVCMHLQNVRTWFLVEINVTGFTVGQMNRIDIDKARIVVNVELSV